MAHDDDVPPTRTHGSDDRRSMTEILESCAAISLERNAREQKEIAHRASCQAANCARCKCGPCKRCGRTMVAGTLPCDTCRRVQAMARESLHVPDSFEHFRWSRLTHPDLSMHVGARAVGHASSIAFHHPVDVVFFGPTGAGKTSLAVATLRAAAERAAERWIGKAVDFAPDGSILPTRLVSSFLIASTWEIGSAGAEHPLGRGRAPIIQRAIDVDVLLLDEVGGGKRGSEPFREAVNHVIFERHNRDRVTWITTWCNSQEVTDIYGGGTMRRLFEDAHRKRHGIDAFGVIKVGKR